MTDAVREAESQASSLDPILATLAMELCLDEELAARYSADPSLVLTQRGLPLDAAVPFDTTGLDLTRAELPKITWCYSTPEPERCGTVA